MVAKTKLEAQEKLRAFAEGSLRPGVAKGALAPRERPEAGLLTIRQALGGYANLRPVKCYEPIANCSPLRLRRLLRL